MLSKLNELPSKVSAELDLDLDSRKQAWQYLSARILQSNTDEECRQIAEQSDELVRLFFAIGSFTLNFTDSEEVRESEVVRGFEGETCGLVVTSKAIYFVTEKKGVLKADLQDVLLHALPGLAKPEDQPYLLIQFDATSLSPETTPSDDKPGMPFIEVHLSFQKGSLDEMLLYQGVSDAGLLAGFIPSMMTDLMNDGCCFEDSCCGGNGKSFGCCGVDEFVPSCCGNAERGCCAAEESYCEDRCCKVDQCCEEDHCCNEENQSCKVENQCCKLENQSCKVEGNCCNQKNNAVGAGCCRE